MPKSSTRKSIYAAKHSRHERMQGTDYEAEQEHMAEQRRQEREREDLQYEQQRNRREEQRKDRAATFERILENAPASRSKAQLRVLLRTVVNLDLYTLADDLAEEFVGDADTERRSAERRSDYRQVTRQRHRS